MKHTNSFNVNFGLTKLLIHFPVKPENECFFWLPFPLD